VVRDSSPLKFTLGMVAAWSLEVYRSSLVCAQSPLFESCFAVAAEGVQLGLVNGNRQMFRNLLQKRFFFHYRATAGVQNTGGY